MTPQRRSWILDVVVGGLVGLVIAAIVAVNLVITAGPDQGYESSLGDVFDHSLVLGFLTLAVLIAGPIIGVVVARRVRSRRPA